MISRDSNTKLEVSSFRQKKAKRSPLGTLIIFIFGVSISIASIGISSKSKAPQMTENNIEILKEDVFTAPAKSTYIKTLFGDWAAIQCVDNCNKVQNTFINSCKEDCNSLKLNSYVKRVSSKEKGLQSDIEEIIKSCTATKLKFPNSSSATQWEVNTRTIFLNALAYEDASMSHSINDLKNLNNRLINNSNFLSLYPDLSSAKFKHDNFINNLSSLFCLYTNSSLARIGQKLADQNNDHQSFEYYKGFINGLKPKSNELKKLLIKDSEELRVKK